MNPTEYRSPIPPRPGLARGSRVRALGAMFMLTGACAISLPAAGDGLSLRDNGPWPNWEGRIGAIIERPANPFHDSWALASPADGGLRMRSLHILSDHYVRGGFRATVGLVSGEASQGWWSGDAHGSGLSLSLQRIDTLGAPSGFKRRHLLPQTQAYVGAGYSNRSVTMGQATSWRFNADFGLLNIDPDGVDHLTGMLQGERSVSEVVRGLRLRPVIKVSIGYAF